MNIVILAVNRDLYSHTRLMEAGKERGHDMRVLNTLKCYMNISSSKPEIHYKNGEIIRGTDAIIPRIGSSITFYGTAVVRQFEMMGVYTLNDSLGISRSRDKLRSLQIFARRGIDMPTTGFANSISNTKDLIQLVGGSPLIVKLLEGTQGVGVVLAETNQASESVINAFKCLNANILVQEYIKEAHGEDIRCFVVGDKVVAAMKRKAKDGEFRSNIHRGGHASKVKITKIERDMAIKATKILGLKVAGVDIIRSARGPMVLEVNSSPGLRGIETVTGVDVAGKIIEYIEKNACLHKKLSNKITG